MSRDQRVFHVSIMKNRDMHVTSKPYVVATRSIHSLTFSDQQQLDLYPFSCPPCCPDTGLSSGYVMVHFPYLYLHLCHQCVFARA